MKKFSCRCGKNVRDVYYKNGELMCVKCFNQSSEYPYDYIINMLAEKGLVITFKNQPDLVMKRLSADDLDSIDELVKPNEQWFVIEGDHFWSHFNGSIDNLRAYVTEYGRKKQEEEPAPSSPPVHQSTSSCSSSGCSTCTSCSNEED